MLDGLFNLKRLCVRKRGRESVPDGVTSPQSDPLGNGSVLLLSSRKLLLGAE